MDLLSRYDFPRNGLQCWFDATDRSSIETDAFDYVKAWEDKISKIRLSSNDKDKPLLAKGAIKGLSVVRFDGSQFLEGTVSKLKFPKRATIFLVARVHNDASYNIISTNLNNETWRLADGSSNVVSLRNALPRKLIPENQMP